MSGSLKGALLECLEATLCPDRETRKTAEERLKALDVTETFGIHLLEIVLNGSFSPPIRQLASVLLRQYVDTHWTSLAEKFITPEPSVQVKSTIREMIPAGLQETQSKIRNSIASVISSIAHWDWPESWPNLFEILMAQLRDEKGVKGAMRVMTEFAKEFTDQHMLQIAPIILPEMLRILSTPLSYTIRTRSRAVDIFRTCINMLAAMGELDMSVISKILDPCLEPFLMAFISSLEEKNPNCVGYGLQKSIVKTICTLLRICPKKLIPYLQHILSPVWGILTSNVETFRLIISGDSEDPELDSDGEQCGAEAVIFSVFDLIHNLAELPSVGSVVKNGLSDLIYYIIFYMQLPQERVEAWVSNPVTFAADEDEDNATYTLRVCAQDLLTATCDEFPEECLVALGQAVTRHLSSSSDWRLQEACLAAVSTLGTRIVKPVQTESPGAWNNHFDIHGFIQNVVFPGLSSQDVLLSGRCLVLGSNFCPVLNPELTRRFVQVATEHIVETDQSVVSRILASKAISMFVIQAKDNLTVKMALLEVLPSTMDALITFATTQSVEILSAFLETMVGILSLDDGFTASIGQKMTTLAIACFVKFNTDPVICPTLEDIVKALCQNRDCFQELQNRFTPTIVSVLNSHNEGSGGPQGVALDILTAIIRASPLPLTHILIQDAFSAVINCVTNSDDHTVLQNTGECLRAFTSVAPIQVFEYRDTRGISGLGHVVQFACRLLDPGTSEFSASLVGKLVTTLIMRTGDRLGDQLELLLRAVLSKLQSADTLSVIQNLCMVYAHLINTQMEAALNFLDSVPGPTGQSALNFVMTEWVSRQQCFFGVFDRKVSSIALCKLLHYGVSTNDPRLGQIEVKGDPVYDTNQPQQMLTRSKKVPEQWTKIPLLVKMFKLLIHELSCSAYEEFETESDNSDTEENDKENYGLSGGGGGGITFTELGDEICLDENGLNLDDPEVMNDPIYSIDLEKYLKEYLKEFSGLVFYPEFLRHINPQESKVLTLCEIPSSTPV